MLSRRNFLGFICSTPIVGPMLARQLAFEAEPTPVPPQPLYGFTEAITLNTVAEPGCRFIAAERLRPGDLVMVGDADNSVYPVMCATIDERPVGVAMKAAAPGEAVGETVMVQGLSIQRI